MLPAGPARMVTIYVHEDAHHGREPLLHALLETLRKEGVAGATVFRALEGFGGHGVLHTPHLELRASHLPLRLEFVERPEAVERLLPGLKKKMLGGGLLFVQDVTVY